MHISGTSAASSEVERAGPGERHARPDTPPPSIGRRTGQISANDTSRRRHDGVPGEGFRILAVALRDDYTVRVIVQNDVRE